MTGIQTPAQYAEFLGYTEAEPYEETHGVLPQHDVLAARANEWFERIWDRDRPAMREHGMTDDNEAECKAAYRKGFFS